MTASREALWDCLQHEQLRKRRCGATDRPRTNADGATERPRTNPNGAASPPAAERFHKQADRQRIERRKAEIERQREELGEAFRHLGYRGAELERALACCATRPEAPLEERLRYALGCMAPKARRECPAPPASPLRQPVSPATPGSLDTPLGP